MFFGGQSENQDDLIGRDIFDFSATTERNSMNLQPLNGIQGRLTKSLLNLLYQVGDFRVNRKTNMASDWARNIRHLLSWNHLT